MAKSHRKSQKKSKKNFLGKFVEGFVGRWAFILGVVFAVVLGLLGNMNEVWVIILIVIGLIIGLLNITEKETTPFLISGTSLVIISALGGNFLYNVEVLANVLGALLVIFVPATVIVAVKSIFNLAKD
jgi:hypothetical protein